MSATGLICENSNRLPPNPALKYGKPYLVGYVGTMSVQDGLDILLDVACAAQERRAAETFILPASVAGRRCRTAEDGQRTRISRTRSTSQGEFRTTSCFDVLSTADVCVNPDQPCEMNDISTMIKIMEYMALGKPIVQFDLKEGRFSAMEASLYADAANPVADFAAKILWLLEHPEERKRMGEFGRRRVEDGTGVGVFRHQSACRLRAGVQQEEWPVSQA